MRYMSKDAEVVIAEASNPRDAHGKLEREVGSRNILNMTEGERLDGSYFVKAIVEVESSKQLLMEG